LKLWIGNIAPEASDDDLRDLLKKYGAVEVTTIERVAEEGSRPAAIVEVVAGQEALYKLTQRLNGLFWKGRSLTAQSMTR
jgi:RNA recognition motif-containing protein